MACWVHTGQRLPVTTPSLTSLLLQLPLHLDSRQVALLPRALAAPYSQSRPEVRYVVLVGDREASTQEGPERHLGTGCERKLELRSNDG
jgi:hypothetical protein